MVKKDFGLMRFQFMHTITPSKTNEALIKDISLEIQRRLLVIKKHQEVITTLEEEINKLEGKMEWISVKDGLPKYSNIVIATDGKETGTSCYDIDEWLGSGNGLDYRSVITHWMELPKPPKGN